MADSAAGEPLGYRHGVVLYSAQTTLGTAVTPATSCGAAKVSWTKHSNNLAVRGPGSANRLAVKGGSTFVDWRIRYDAAQSGVKTLLTKIERASGVLPLLTLGFGYQDDVGTPNKSADQIQDCKVTSLRLGLDATGDHSPLTAELSGVGGLVTVLTTLVPATLTTVPWMSYEGVFTRAGSAYQLRSFDVTKESRVTRDNVIPGAAPSTDKRGFKYLTEHEETIRGNISRYAVSGISEQSTPIPTTFAMVLVLTEAVAGTVLTLTFAGVDFDEVVVDEDEGGIFYSWAFEANSLAIT
jgi:hypothetical protein